MSVRNGGPSAIECEANVLSRELDGDQDQTNQHEWNQAVANEDAALEGAGFEYDEIGNIVD